MSGDCDTSNIAAEIITALMPIMTRVQDLMSSRLGALEKASSGTDEAASSRRSGAQASADGGRDGVDDGKGAGKGGKEGDNKTEGEPAHTKRRRKDTTNKISSDWHAGGRCKGCNGS